MENSVLGDRTALVKAGDTEMLAVGRDVAAPRSGLEAGYYYPTGLGHSLEVVQDMRAVVQSLAEAYEEEARARTALEKARDLEESESLGGDWAQQEAAEERHRVAWRELKAARKRVREALKRAVRRGCYSSVGAGVGTSSYAAAGTRTLGVR